MKKTYPIVSILLLFCLLTAFESCKKDNDNSSDNPADTTLILKVKVNGKDFPISFCTASLDYFHDTSAAFRIIIYDTLDREIMIDIEHLDSRLPFLKTYYSQVDAWMGLYGVYSPLIFYPKEGQVTLSKFDRINKKLSGHFSFKGLEWNQPDSVITTCDGQFDNITYEPLP